MSVSTSSAVKSGLWRKSSINFFTSLWRQELAEDTLSQYSQHFKYTILYKISHTISYTISRIFHPVMLYRIPKTTYDVVGQNPTYTISYIKTYDIEKNLRYRRKNLRYRRFLTVSCQSYVRYYLRYRIRYRRFDLRYGIRLRKKLRHRRFDPVSCQSYPTMWPTISCIFVDIAYDLLGSHRYYTIS